MNKNNYTDELNGKQVNELISFFDTVILEEFDDDLNASAKEYGALKRKREIKCAKKLLLALFIYATQGVSFNVLSAFSVLLGIGDVTSRALAKKFSLAEEWLKHLLNCCINRLYKIQLPETFNDREMRLIDASHIRQDGKEENQRRAHVSFNLGRGVIDQVIVTGKKVAEGFEHFVIKKGAIYIADAGYSRVKQMLHIIANNADFIIRVAPNNFCIYDAKGNKINLFKLLINSKKKLHDIPCFIKDPKTKELRQIRLISRMIPNDKIEQAIANKKKKSKNKKGIKKETLEFAKWVILATSLDYTYSVEDILLGYRSRWQIELLFKRFKQMLKVSTIKKGSEAYATAIVYMWFIVWTITEKSAILAEINLIEQGVEPETISKWTTTEFSFVLIKTMITNEIINALLLASKETINKALNKLTIRKRERVNQYITSRKLINVFSINTN